jgi:hypothetical protein
MSPAWPSFVVFTQADDTYLWLRPACIVGYTPLRRSGRTMLLLVSGREVEVQETVEAVEKLLVGLPPTGTWP